MHNNLPLNWCECCIKDIANIQTGKLDANAAVENGIYPFFTCALEPLRINTFSFDGNCIYLPGNGANVGYVGYYQGKFDAYQRTYVLDKIAINERYLYFSILLNWKNYNKDKQFGVATNFIRLGNLENYPINLPPLAEQERIVAKIEALFASIDEGVERLKSAQAQIKQYCQSVLKSAFEQCKHRGTINDIAQLIKIGPFGSLLHKSDYVKKGIPLVNPSHIKNLNILPNKDICVLPSKLKQLQSYVLKKHDIIIGRRGEMGRCAVVEEQQEGWLCGTGSMFLRLEKENYPYFYALYIASQQCIQYLEKNAMGTTMKNLNEKIIKKVPIPLPSLPEQQRIVEEIEKRFFVADELEKAVNEGLEKADKLKQSILKKAFEGKLVPQDPNDEPASVLLERIKKSQTPTKGKKK